MENLIKFVIFLLLCKYNFALKNVFWENDSSASSEESNEVNFQNLLNLNNLKNFQNQDLCNDGQSTNISPLILNAPPKLKNTQKFFIYTSPNNMPECNCNKETKTEEIKPYKSTTLNPIYIKDEEQLQSQLTTIQPQIQATTSQTQNKKVRGKNFNTNPSKKTKTDIEEIQTTTTTSTTTIPSSLEDDTTKKQNKRDLNKFLIKPYIPFVPIAVESKKRKKNKRHSYNQNLETTTTTTTTSKSIDYQKLYGNDEYPANMMSKDLPPWPIHQAPPTSIYLDKIIHKRCPDDDIEIPTYKANIQGYTIDAYNDLDENQLNQPKAEKLQMTNYFTQKFPNFPLNGKQLQKLHNLNMIDCKNNNENAHYIKCRGIYPAFGDLYGYPQHFS